MTFADFGNHKISSGYLFSKERYESNLKEPLFSFNSTWLENRFFLSKHDNGFDVGLAKNSIINRVSGDSWLLD